MTTVRTFVFCGLLFLRPACLPAQPGAVPAPLALSLHDAVRLALSPQGSIGIEVATEGERAAAARVREGHAAWLPQVELSFTGQDQVMNLAASGFANIQLPVAGFSFPRSVGPFSTVDARMRIRQDVLDWASRSRARVLRAGVQTAKDETGEEQDGVAAEVAKLYLAALRAAGTEETAQSVVTWAGAGAQEVERRNGAGKALAVEVARARQRLAGEKQHLLEAHMERGRAGFDLLSALNRDLDTPLELTDHLEFTPQPAMEPRDAVAQALKARAELMTLRQRLAASRLDDGAIRSERLPTVAAYADAGSLGTTPADSVGTYTVGVSLRIPVFDGGRRSARREETQAAMRQEELRATQMARQIELEVRQALVKLEMARGEVDLAAQEIEVARQELEHHRRRFDQGIGDELEVAEAQLTLARANGNRTETLYMWNEARIELMRAMGNIKTLAQ